MDQYDSSAIEAKWQARWNDGDCFAVSVGQGRANYVAGSPYPSAPRKELAL